VLVVRVHKFVPKDAWKPRYDFITEWEKLLAIENSTTIPKFLLYVSREEQLARFNERLDDPGRQWKISNSDYTERNLWDEYIDAFETACLDIRPNTRRGLSFLPITNGFVISRYPRSSPIRWMT